MDKMRYMFPYILCAVIFFMTSTVYADPGKFFIVGMGTTPDLLTIRGAEVIKQSQIVMLEQEQDREAWEKLRRAKREVWIVPHSARLYLGLDPEAVIDAKLEEVKGTVF